MTFSTASVSNSVVKYTLSVLTAAKAASLTRLLMSAPLQPVVERATGTKSKVTSWGLSYTANLWSGNCYVS